ncbi:BTAD domain-containing putative transcriptional regulator [Dactylosporangium cerinum]|uniref:BTAD domain-containing putative transcriptional regulator n=1 Tax=Dactylosporangium cerinum TaxID=1434730 RepID=A0ABV9VR79_9ACTN
MDGGFRFEILGPQRAWAGDRPLDLGPAKQRAVLGVLLLQPGRPVPTAQIIDAVWPHDLPENATNVLQKYIAALRRLLEPDRSPRTPSRLLTLSEAGYQLAIDPFDVDATEFEAAVDAATTAHAAGRDDEAADGFRAGLRLWKGEPFAGLGGPVFEAVRVRLGERRVSASEALAEIRLRRGDHRELIADLAALVEEFPLHERLRLLLMLSLHRSGRPTDALQTFRELRTLLDEEHGIEPGEELQDLQRRILRSDPALAYPSTLPIATGKPATTTAPAPVSSAAAWNPVSPAPMESPTTAPVSPAPFLVAPPKPPQPSQPPPLPPLSPPVPFPQDHALMRAPAGAQRWPPYALGVDPFFGTEFNRQPWITWVETVLGIIAGACTLCLLAWVPILYHATRRRSGRLFAAAFGYFVVAAFFWVLMIATVEDDGSSWADPIMIPIVIIVSIGVPVHVLLLNEHLRHVWRRRRNGPIERRVQARQLLVTSPVARFALAIGRPDLVRTHNDGGLIDVNAVPEHVIYKVLGMRRDVARRIIAERAQRGPFTSMLDLTVRCAVGPDVTAAFNDRLLFLPPPPDRFRPQALRQH